MQNNALLLHLKDLKIGHQHSELPFSLEHDFFKGEKWAILGPNGCGKSTLLKTISRQLKPKDGKVIVNGNVIYIDQKNFNLSDFPIQVDEWMKYSFGSQYIWGQRLSEEQVKTLQQIEQDYLITDYKNKSLSELSGGQIQRVILSRVEIQNSDIILLDEPFSFLDQQSQHFMIKRIDVWTKEHQKLVLCITHDWLQALRHFDQFLVFEGNQIHFFNKQQMHRHFHHLVKEMGDIC